MAKKKTKGGEPYQSTQQEIDEYKPGVPPTEDSRVYRLVKKMSIEELPMYEEKYMAFLKNTESNTMNYEIAYHKWFALRWEGENRELWSFIPVPDRIEDEKENTL